MKTVNGHIQVYNIWVNGRDIEDNNQHYPIDNNIEDNNVWHNNLKKAVTDFENVVIEDRNITDGLYSDIYSDYHVAFYSIDINVKEFENMFDLDFDLDDDRVQEMIPYYVNYDFNVVTEKVCKFKNIQTI